MDGRFLRLPRNCQQSLFNRQTGANQGCKLSGDKGSVPDGKGRTEEPRKEPRALRVILLSRVVDPEGGKAPVTKNLAYLAHAVRLENALFFPALCVQGNVLECCHPTFSRLCRAVVHIQSSIVTRSTSSMVVRPSSTQFRPSSRMPGVSVRRYFSMSGSETPE